MDSVNLRIASDSALELGGYEIAIGGALSVVVWMRDGGAVIRDAQTGVSVLLASHFSNP